MKKSTLKTKLVLRKETIKALDRELPRVDAGREVTPCTGVSSPASGCFNDAIVERKE